MNLEWHPEARIEPGKAALYYNMQEPGLGEVLTGNVHAATVEIKDDPLRHSQFDPPYRKVVTERFPY